MLQQFVDHILAVTKESVKTFTYESLNNIVRLINGISALLLAFLPGKTPILEGMHGWELRPTFRGPRFPRWMENGVSSFNQFIHDLSLEFDSLEEDYASAEENEEEDIFPSSPLSQSSRLSHSSSFSRYDRSRSRKIRRMLSFLLWAIKFFFFFPLFIFRSIMFGRRGGVRSSDISAETKSSSKDQVVDRATDRRRGVVEDMQLAIEIIIENVFHFFHKAAHFLLSPREACMNMWRWWTVHEDRHEEVRADMGTNVQASILADDDPSLTERHTRFHQSLNTDARTCEDVIREHGYPYESFKLVTDDGYILLLERIPRRDSQKVVYLQHGILDSSMGWVSNGVVGSPAFAAFDQGYDVFLGNFRGLVSREHIDNNISSHKYWNYSVNEHGTEDIPTIISKIHQVKISELNSQSQQLTLTDQPYKLCAVSHSLGGAAMIMYVITQRTLGRAHRLTRLILLSPAGFHGESTLVFTFMEHVLLLLGPLLAYIIPALYIPTRFFRLLINKLARDFHNYPALGGLVQTLMSYVAGGDSSNWVGALGLPHYNVYDMPGLSLHVGIHLAQMKRRGKFMMYDYGSAAANVAAYGSSDPPDLGELYRMIDVPVDLVAGRKDQVIRASMVRKHYKMMKRAGVEVTFNEFEYAHLDFTFSHREELLGYVMSRVMLVAPPEKGSHGGSVRNRRGGRNQERSEEIVEDGVDNIGR